MTELKKAQDIINKRLGKYPPGLIHIINSKGRVQYYLRKDSSDKNGSYISKKDDKKLRCYLQKWYDRKAVHLIENEITYLEKFLAKTTSINQKIKAIYSDHPDEIKQLIIPIDISDEDYVNEWLSQTYEKKPIGESDAVHETDLGEFVRSKSELNIANKLAKAHIPYKYECPIKLANGQIIYPDFTILDVRNRKEILWEHRGMMDDREYSKNSVLRLKILNKEGFILGDNLIITEETQTAPLGTNEIDRVIKRFKTIC